MYYLQHPFMPHSMALSLFFFLIQVFPQLMTSHFYFYFPHAFISADEVFILSHKVSSLRCLCYHVASLNFLDDDFYPSTPLNFSLIQVFPVNPSIFSSLLFTWYHYSGEWGFLPINRVSSLQCWQHLQMFPLFHFYLVFVHSSCALRRGRMYYPVNHSYSGFARHVHL